MSAPKPGGLRELRVAAVGHPAPFTVTAPAYALAVLGWTAAATVLALSSGALVDGAIFDDGIVLMAHLVGLVLFPFAVAAAVWQLLPVMLRNDPPTRRLRPLVLVLLAAGVPLTVAVAFELEPLAVVVVPLLVLGLLLLLAEVVSLIRGAPAGKRLVVSRPAVALALANAAIAFALGVVAFVDGGPEPLGVGYERFLLLHLSVALIGWLTVLIAAVGRTLVPMLALAPAARARSLPFAEAAIVAGLWIYAAGLAAPTDALIAIGIVVMALGLASPARVFVSASLTGKLGVREAPVAHVVLGLAFVAQAAALGVIAVIDAIEGRRAAIAAVVLLGLGWAVGVIVGHVGKLASLSGWGSWPPGPRPKQEALYPRGVWQLEVVVFVIAVELLAAGVVFESQTLATLGGTILVVAALLATAGVAETTRRVWVHRRTPPIG